MAGLRLDKDAAHRLIARFLREKMSPDDANRFAAKICDSLHASMTKPMRPDLHSWRMIPGTPSLETSGRLAKPSKVTPDVDG